MHRICVVGYGGMGGHHVNALSKQFTGILELAGIVDIRQERCEYAKEKGIHVYNGIDEAIADDSVDIYVLAVPNNFHKPLAEKLMRAGRNVILEKPACLCAKDFEELMQTSKETGMMLTVHQNRRWDRDYRMVKEVYQKQPIGRVYMMENRVQGSRQVLNGWRGVKENGGGMVYDWGVHLIDQYLDMVQSPVTEVYAHLFNLYSKEVDDNFKCMLRFANGVSALVEVSMNCFILHPRWHVCGETGTCVIDDWSCKGKMVRLATDKELEWDECIVYSDAGPTRSMAPRPVETVEELPLPDLHPDWGEFYRGVCGYLDGKCDLPVKPETVLRVLKVMDAVFESAAMGQSVKCNI